MSMCPVHNVPFKQVPAGISKMGKPYAAFWSCSEYGCREKPVQGQAAQAPKAGQSSNVRLEIAKAFISAGKDDPRTLSAVLAQWLMFVEGRPLTSPPPVQELPVINMDDFPMGEEPQAIPF